MAFLKNTALFGALALITKVSAHGTVQGIVAGGVFYRGYSPSFAYANPPPVVAGWSIPEDSDNGYVNDYTSPDMICHKGATPGGAYVTVTAGDTVEVQWTVWPSSHHGPMIDYLASCGDDCTTVDKTALLFNKIDEKGLDSGSPSPGIWASDDMIANNNSWVVTIPSSIAPGKYVLRHETIALHSAYDVGGAQNYPQCINLEVTGSGTDSLSSGTLGTDLYTSTDAGIHLNIYYPVLTSYDIPGPALYSGSGGSSSPQSSAVAAVSTSASSAAMSSAAASSNATSMAAIPTGRSSGRPSGRPSGKPSGSVSISAVPTTGVAVVTTPAPTSAEPSSAPVESYSAPAESSSAPASSDVAPVPSSSDTSPVSFTSTVTGRMGMPTKFTCYAEE